jgi:hypothetical protein
MGEVKRLWEEFPELVKEVWNDHYHRILGIHDFYHPLLTAYLAGEIAEPVRFRELAQVAGLCHNTDRIFEYKINVEKRIREYLDLTWFSAGDRNLILEAVFNHGKLNNPTDNPITVILKDADRLASAHGALCLVRTGQANPNIPTFDPAHIRTRSPGATYFDCKTALDGLEFVFEWQGMLRCPKAVDLGKLYFGQLRQLLDDIKLHVETTGLCDFDTWLKTQTQGGE